MSVAITTIEELVEEVEKIYLIKDKGVIPVLVATVIANMMPFRDAVWLLLVAPPSGGKTELIQALSSLPFIHKISSLTVNTFASGMKVAGKETSLLHKINNGIMVFKDFTTIIEMNKDARKEIMSQLREIYDGEFYKRTGNTKDTLWRGKVGSIAGATEAVYEHMSQFSAMGDRFIMYSIEQPDRMEVARRVLENTHDMEEKREHMKKCFESYINHVMANLPSDDIVLSDKMKNDLLEVANFATLVRSAVMLNERTGRISFVPAAEMPMRVAQQLYMIASAFVAMNKASSKYSGMKGGETEWLSEEQVHILYKVAFDSIPKKRRITLQKLAKHGINGVTTAGLATNVGYETEEVKSWLAQLNSLGICSREKFGGKYGDKWKMHQQYVDMMVKFEHITVVESLLEAPEGYIEEDQGETESLDYAAEQERRSHLSQANQETDELWGDVFDDKK